MDSPNPIAESNTPLSGQEVAIPPVLITPPSNTTPSNKLIPLLVILLIFALGAAGFFAFKYFQTQSPTSPGEVSCTLDALACPDGSAVGRSGPNCEFAPCPSADPTANWQTYNNQEHNFSLKYPPDWQIRNPIPGDNIIIYLDGPTLGIEGKTFIYIDTVSELPNYSFTQKLLNGNNSYFTTDKPSGPGGSLSYYIESLDGFINVSITPNDEVIDPKLKEHLTIFDQILSTFHFTDLSTDTSNWKTYANSQYGFSFLYPQDWQIEAQTDSELRLSGIAEGHEISIIIWRVTGFGYCFKYGEKQEIEVNNIKSQTADGVGGKSPICDADVEIESLGNTFVLIPLEDGEDIEPMQIHISYDYPLANITEAKATLDQILSTFEINN